MGPIAMALQRQGGLTKRKEEWRIMDWRVNDRNEAQQGIKQGIYDEDGSMMEQRRKRTKSKRMEKGNETAATAGVAANIPSQTWRYRSPCRGQTSRCCAARRP